MLSWFESDVYLLSQQPRSVGGIIVTHSTSLLCPTPTYTTTLHCTRAQHNSHPLLRPECQIK